MSAFFRAYLNRTSQWVSMKEFGFFFSSSNGSLCFPIWPQDIAEDYTGGIDSKYPQHW